MGSLLRVLRRRSALSGLLFVFAGTAFAGDISEIHLQPDEVAIIGYGSLMNRESMERSLGHPYSREPIDISLENWQRTWNVAMPNDAFYLSTPQGKVFPKKVAYLNIQKAPGKSMNATLFVIKRNELDAFNRREWIYNPVDLAENLKGAKITGGPVIAYVGKEEYLVGPEIHFPEVGVRKSYFDTVENALAQKPQAYRDQFHSSTSRPSAQPFADRKEEGTDPFGYEKLKKQAPAECEVNFAAIGK